MKKIVALVLSLVMVLGLASTAFAANEYEPAAYYYDAMTMTEADTFAYFAKSDYVPGGMNWLAHFVGEDAMYFVGGITKMYKAGGKLADVTKGKVATVTDIFYQYEAKAFGEQKWSCTKDGVKADYTYVDENGDTQYANKDAAGALTLLVGEKVVTATPVTEIIKAGHCLVVMDGVGPVELDVGVYSAWCVICKNDVKISKTNANYAGHLYETGWTDVLEDAGKTYAIPVGYHELGSDAVCAGPWYVIGESAPAAGGAAGETVESAKTFDAGIAMYVGMSVMAAAGSAVVLKKKD